MQGRAAIHTIGAPQAIGTYSQALKVGDWIFLSGQLPLVPKTMQLVEGGMVEQTLQVFNNLIAVAEAAGGALRDVVKLTVFLTELANFSVVNEVMAQVLTPPFPARSTIGVAALPRGALIEIEAIMILPSR